MKVGSDWGGAGTFKPLTSAVSGAQRVADAHGRFFDACAAGRLYRGGMTLTSISNATFTTATTGATATPIIGLWNPSTSTVNLVVLQAGLNVAVTAATNTGCGAFMWMVSLANSAISTGSNPFNQKTLVATGSQAKFYAGTALTGMTGTLAVMSGSTLTGGSLANFSFVGTAAGQVTPAFGTVENFDGSVIVPPGAVLSLQCGTTPVAHSASSFIVWEEVPVALAQV
jgi:hypothetical protein